MGSLGLASGFSHEFANHCTISTIEEHLCETPCYHRRAVGGEHVVRRPRSGG